MRRYYNVIIKRRLKVKNFVRRNDEQKFFIEAEAF